MSRVVELLRARRAPHLAALAVMSVGFAGCSADTTRFTSNSFLFEPRPPEATGAVAAPSGQVEGHPLPQYQPSPTPPQTMPARQYSANSSYQPPASRSIPTYNAPERPIEATGSAAPRSVAATAHWNRDDGAMIIVGTSDTLEGISQRYGVPARDIMKANGLPTPRALQPGQSLFVPRPGGPAAAPAIAAAPPTRPAVSNAQAGAVHVVNPGETLMSIARHSHTTAAKLAKANNLAPNAPLRIGMKLTIPGAKVAAAAPQSAPTIAAPSTKVQQVASAQPLQKPVPQTLSLPAPKETAHVATETKEIEQAVKPADATGGLPSFRWPVRGRVIAGYGAKTSGKQNDGINVAVPEGTPIKAAEDGEVTYAGNELKGYGNLVLVRHSNGYVTAYAHASELLVKRGEKIKRGQIIAKSGQTGEVQSPQLHFEIRKGSAPVDPTQFLNGA